jgi:hypothetical protein
VTFIPLAPIADPSLVVSTIARALDVPEVGERPLQESLAAALSLERPASRLRTCRLNTADLLPSDTCALDLVTPAPAASDPMPRT